ncbi:hypothetical protein BKA62DRAFT_150115 [Auriculariales sp. MPI-PUGE-AT-0066]|nr:hypothetical protein BKA62DRAFT_150115 [Auriculariales sp. MPI-PUGE-AT-0066]
MVALLSPQADMDINYMLGEGTSSNPTGLIFSQLHIEQPQYPYEPDEEDAQDGGAQRRQDKMRVGLPLEKWRNVGLKGYISLLKRVEELWWTPVLYDEDCYDFQAFCTYAGVNPTARDSRRLHERAVKKLGTQKSLLAASEPQEHLRKAFSAMRKLNTLLIRPTRHSNRSAKSERLNVFALTSALGALGKSRPRDVLTLRIFDVDLTALMLLSPPGPESFVANSVSDDWLLPANLSNVNELRAIARSVFLPLTTLHWAFVRAEELEPRLALERDETGETQQEQVRRISSVLARCQHLESLKLAFHRPEGIVDSTIPAADDSVLALSGIQSNSTHNFAVPVAAQYQHQMQAQVPEPVSEAAAPTWRVAPVEIDIKLILPYCQSIPTVVNDSRRLQAGFRFLREFVLSTIVLPDSNALHNFITNHPLLEEIGLEDVGIRHGPTWSAILAHIKKSLFHIRQVSAVRLMHVDHVSGYLVNESPQLYRLAWIALGSTVQFRYAF